MEKKKVTVGRPVTAAGVTLVPVSQVTLGRQRAKGAVYAFGSHRPVGILVVAPEPRTAIRITGEPVSVEQFLEETPGLKEALEEQSIIQGLKYPS